MSASNEPCLTKWHSANTPARGAKDSICHGGADNADTRFRRTAVPRVAGERTPCAC
jgi:hypothetical protein